MLRSSGSQGNWQEKGCKLLHAVSDLSVPEDVEGGCQGQRQGAPILGW